MRPAIFFDRDGTLSREVGYVNHLSRFELYPFAVDAVRLVNRSGLLAVLITNQAGVAPRPLPPGPGRLQRAARELEIDVKRSWVIGDRHSDIELAARVGARSALVKTGYGVG